MIGCPAPPREESALVIMIAVRDRRDAWVEPTCRPEEIMWRAVVGAAAVHLERNGALYRVQVVVCSKTLDNADIVREAIYQQFAAFATMF